MLTESKQTWRTSKSHLETESCVARICRVSKILKHREANACEQLLCSSLFQLQGFLQGKTCNASSLSAGSLAHILSKWMLKILLKITLGSVFYSPSVSYPGT